MKAFVSWSGGKESAMAYYKASMGGAFEVKYLINMVSSDARRSCSHGINAALIKAQSHALKTPIVQKRTNWNNYGEVFKKAILELKDYGVEAGIFGDIDVEEHRDWVERICGEAGVRAVLPLWGKAREKLVKEFIKAGFKAFVVTTKSSLMGAEWLGRPVNEKFIADIKNKGGIDVCGENGEYHTFVTDGPIFKRPVEFSVMRKMLRGNYWFLEVNMVK